MIFTQKCAIINKQQNLIECCNKYSISLYILLDIYLINILKGRIVMDDIVNANLQFCEKCNLYFFTDIETGIVPEKCKFCGNHLTDTGVSYEEYKMMPKVKRCPKCKRKFPKMFIKCSKCNFQLVKLSNENRQLDKKMNEINKQTQEYQEQQTSKVKCPYCNSTDVSKISTAGRVVSVGLFGLGSSKIGKQWHCKKCGSDF